MTCGRACAFLRGNSHTIKWRPNPLHAMSTPAKPASVSQASLIQPVELGLDSMFQFRSRKEILCFNAGCRDIDLLSKQEQGPMDDEEGLPEFAGVFLEQVLFDANSVKAQSGRSGEANR